MTAPLSQLAQHALTCVQWAVYAAVIIIVAASLVRFAVDWGLRRRMRRVK